MLLSAIFILCFLIIAIIRYLLTIRVNGRLKMRVEEQRGLISDLAQQQGMVNDLLREIENGIMECAGSLEMKEELWLDQCGALLNKSSYVDNPILAVMLASKEKSCIGKGISFQCKMQLPSEEHRMAEVDLVGLLVNLLDNAIEAASLAEEKKVTVISQEHAGVWSIKIENSKSREQHPDQNNFRTTKTDSSRHGYGMKIVKKIVEKYKGVLRTEDAGDCYIIKVSI